MRVVGRRRDHFVYLITFALSIGFAACSAQEESEDDESALSTPAKPVINRILVGDGVVWMPGQNAPVLRAGQEITLEGENFGSGPANDLSKVLVGNSRALERDIPVYKSDFHITRELTGGELYDEKPEVVDAWQKDILAWSDTRITMRVPVTTGSAGGRAALVVHVQKYIGRVTDPSGRVVKVRDPLTDFLVHDAPQRAAVHALGIPGPPASSDPIPVMVDNPEFEASRKRGEATFWSYDFNLGVAHKLAKVGWDDIFAGRARDPVTGRQVDPRDFGAIPIYQGDGVIAPDIVRREHFFDPYPVPSALESIISSSQKSGTTKPIGWAGYVLAEGKHPLLPGPLGRNEWIGFGCASCHARLIEYEPAPGQRVSKLFGGLPNHKWNAKFLTYSGESKGMKGREAPSDSKPESATDKTMLVYSIPDGTAEASLTPEAGKGGFSNDFSFSPVAIPIITRHTPLRRALSRGEHIAGFEGSYLHPQAPEGTMGPMRIPDLKDLTTYMTTLDEDHDTLVTVGLYEWMKHKGLLGQIDNVAQGELVSLGLERAQARFPALKTRIDRGQAIFKRDCQSCHPSNFGTNTDESIMAFTDVGTYFSPSLWNRDGGGIRTAILRDLYWVQGRGMLHDGHVRSSDPDHLDSVEMLIAPGRCNPSSELYEKIYSISATSFRVPKGTPEQERATRQQGYFVDWPFGGGGDESRYLYWDYQKMRSSFGPRELGTAVKELPQAPHPWCAKRDSEVQDLLHYLFTL